MNVRLKQMLAIGLAGFGLGVAGIAHAVPAVQLGLPLPGGGYAPYVGSLSDPTETDTAVTTDSPFNLAVGMAYKDQGQTSVLLMGGQYGPDGNGISGLNWSDFGYASVFDSHGAVLMVSTAGAGTTLMIDGVSSFYDTGTFENGFIVPNPPSNHAPIKPGDGATHYYFFDIGDFARATGSVPNFADPGDTNVDGEVKTFTVDVAGFDWAHFDAFALETTDETICTDLVTGKKCGKKTTLSSTIYDTSTAGNPGSHDVTWKPGDYCETHPEDPDCAAPPDGVPEIDAVAGTGALTLLVGAVALAGERRRRKSA